MRAMGGAELQWDPATQLLAVIVDLLNAANWQRGGGKGPRPKPIPRPGDGAGAKDTKRWGTPVPLAEGRRILDEWSTN